MAVAISELYLFNLEKRLNLPVYKYSRNNAIFKIHLIIIKALKQYRNFKVYLIGRYGGGGATKTFNIFSRSKNKCQRQLD